jgi:hypothetical protein
VRQHFEEITNRDLVEPDLLEGGSGPPVRDRGHAFRERLQDRRGTPHRVGLERLSARKHEDDEDSGEVFTEEDRGDDGDSREEIRSEFAAEESDTFAAVSPSEVP